MSATTTAERVYQALRTDILEGRLAPGKRLGFAQLHDAYRASMGVLREVLTRLTVEGLAVSHAQQGFKVVSLSIEDLQELTDTRCLIESNTLRDSILHGDLEWESAVVAAHHRLQRIPQKSEEDDRLVSNQWAKAHHDFHAALLAGATNRRMRQISEGLRASAEVYRQWSTPFEDAKRDVNAEHDDLLAAALDRDADRAAELLVNHLRFTAQLIIDGTSDAGITPLTQETLS